MVQQEPSGFPAGEIARQLAVPHATMSAHLSVLSWAGLVVSRRQGRSIIYRANLNHMQEAIRFLVNDCCAEHPAVCGPLADEQLINAMMAEPILINRPIVVTHKGTRLCRPSETVLNLPEHPVAHFVKEDGETLLKSSVPMKTNEVEKGCRGRLCLTQ
ncbi:ArsC/Spx/MgsR family protein [Halomonas sp. LS-001]